MPFKFNGVSDVKAKFKVAVGTKPQEVAGALYRTVEKRIVTPSKLITPVKTGNLRSSIHAEDPKVGRTISVEVAAGGPATPYAVAVHENLMARHPNGGQAKYLEQPYVEEMPRLLQDVADEMK